MRRTNGMRDLDKLKHLPSSISGARTFVHRDELDADVHDLVA